MKLTIVGGGGFRVPLVHAALLRDDLIDEVSLLDTDPARLAVIDRVLTAQAGTASRPRHRLHTDPAKALEGADFVFSAVRAGGVQQGEGGGHHCIVEESTRDGGQARVPGDVLGEGRIARRHRCRSLVGPHGRVLAGGRRQGTHSLIGIAAFTAAGRSSSNASV